jgi:acetyltransferase-like isoleucine patch superfamily enzyme
MALAGVPVLGRLAVRLATLGCRPLYGRQRLARYHPRGFVAPAARISHSGLSRGRNVFIADRVAILREHQGGPVTLGDRVHLNEDVRMVTSLGGSITIGADTHVQPGCHLMGVLRDVRIGRNVQIGPNCAFYPYDHGMRAGLPIHEQPIESKGDIEIADDAWLGFGVIVLAGVSIGAGAVVGAGAIVSKDIPAGAIAAGSPARVLRMRE